MSYCVNCGVKLNVIAEVCPLCGTPVNNPNQPPMETRLPFFPTHPPEVTPVSRRVMALLVTAMLASVSICCGLLNLILQSRYQWHLFVLGAAAMLWVWFVLPLLASRWIPLWGRLTLDVGAVAVYVWLIALAVDGGDWFWGLAIPTLAVAAAVVCGLSWLLRRRHSILTTTTLSLVAVGALCMGMEACGDLYFHSEWMPGWSLVVLASCVGVCIPLLVVRRVPSLREEVRRRFHI